MSNNNKALILMSAGMDSALCASIAQSMGYELYFVHFSYGQKTQTKELECFHKMSDHFKVKDKFHIDLSFFKHHLKSSLTDENNPVLGHDQSDQNAPTSYVPYRNTMFLSMALSLCESYEIDHLYIGANEQDSPGYPDCRKSYYEAFKSLIKEAQPHGQLKLHTPVIDFTKKEIVQKGLELSTPFELTWSCYKSQNKACGQCDSCYLRRKGFQENNMTDPIQYIKKV